MDSKDLKLLEKEILSYKRSLRQWEETFERKYKRPATVEDIRGRPSIAKFYKRYNELKKKFNKELEARAAQKSSSQRSLRPPSSGRVLFPEASDSENKIPPKAINRQLTEEEAFWLNIPASDNNSTTSHGLSKTSSDIEMTSSCSSFNNTNSFSICTGNDSQDVSNNNNNNNNNNNSNDNDGFSIPAIPEKCSQTTQPQPHLSMSQPVKTTTTKQKSPQPTSSSQPTQKRKLMLAPVDKSQRHERKKRKTLNSTENKHSLNGSSLYSFSDLKYEEEEKKADTNSQVSMTTDDDNTSEDDDDDDETAKLFTIVEYQENHFRHYDPSIFRWDDPDFSIGPQFFGSHAVCKNYLTDPIRRARIQEKLKKGILGEVNKENDLLEQEILRKVQEEYKDMLPKLIPKTNPKTETNTEKVIEFKRKPIQRRQTRLVKIKFCD
ncbi:hypothetical protein CU097_013516 [Rhizopus azygosporus]|uniref:DNA replication regulator SLD2 n=1 Tax=Rhizopus azygosporus TaxID=86630 RepID=A0A367K346_RHIAZ|nr:hypothetical protein CU097_013516 [Rhizopus azygosporus]